MQVAIPDPANAKQALRHLIRGRIPSPVSPEVSAAIVTRILETLSAKQLAGPVSLFAPRSDEPDLLTLTRDHPGTCRLFPRVAGDRIVLHHITDHGKLSPGRFGILEPPEDAPVLEPETVRVFLCPGIAFDSSGHRLGRGGGFYDRLLAHRSPDSLVIGVCCEEQIVTKVPAEEHDARMDLVITGRRTLNPSRIS